MIITIKNCNNIRNGKVVIEDNHLNIKYGINGTGKSTISKGIEYVANKDSSGLKRLTPYFNIGTTDDANLPCIEGVPDETRIALFNEDYVNQYVFMEDELIKNSFDIFVRTTKYDECAEKISQLISSIHKMFENFPELESLINDMNEFVSSFGPNTKNGISAKGELVKGLSKGNIITNIPTGLEDFTEYLRNEKNSAWLKWQATGRTYLEISSKCPFCANDIQSRRGIIEKLSKEYDAKVIEHLSKIISLFERLGHYFSQDTKNNVNDIARSITGLSMEQKEYLVGIKNNVELILKKLQSLKNLGFASLKDVDVLRDTIESMKIDMKYIPHLNTEYTIQKIEIINSSIDELLNCVGELQGAINIQKIEIKNTINKYSKEINTFLKNAGYPYIVSIMEESNQSYKLKLLFNDSSSAVSSVKSHLSYGERNAFALVLFMYQAIYNQSNFIVLDDPISSFDQNKKFAILDMLFIKNSSLRGKTVLMLTHDFEPVIDAIYNHPDFFDRIPKAMFLDNNEGYLKEIVITREDIKSSVKIAKDNVRCLSNIVSKTIFLRRLIEISEGKTSAWHLLSNLIHRREIPVIGDEQMSEDSIKEAVDRIQKDIEGFNYDELLKNAFDNNNLFALYDSVQSKYEKLQIYRILFDPKKKSHVVRKFINETYHVENDYLFQLDPVKFNTIPNYIIAECDKEVNQIRRETEERTLKIG